MDTKLLARVGAGAFIAVVAVMTLLDLREESHAGPADTITVFEPDGDPLPAQLRACAAMGEVALSVSDCRAAWAEKRRRFLGRGASSPDVAAPPIGARPSADAAQLGIAATANAAPDGVAASGVR